MMRVEFEMGEPVRYLWGFIATLKSATGRLEFERVEPDVWLPQSFDFAIDLPNSSSETGTSGWSGSGSSVAGWTRVTSYSRSALGRGGSGPVRRTD